MRETHARQYDLPCVIADRTDPAQMVIDRCHMLGAVRKLDGVEYVVQLRPEVGPELWTDESLRVSLPAPLPAGYKTLAARQAEADAEVAAVLAAPLEVGDWVDVDGVDDVRRVAAVDSESGRVGVVTPEMWDAGNTADPAYVDAAEVKRNVMMTLMPPPID
jgi:hypothetical protein